MSGIKIRFKNGERTYIMKVKERYENGDVMLIDGSLIKKEEIIEIFKIEKQ